MNEVQVLSYSGGWQSSAIAWMAIRGEIKLPKHFAMVTADTGDERQRTYEQWPVIWNAAKEAGIDTLLAEGPKIPEDYTPENQSTRIDSIPYWTKKPDGKRGQLKHKCTRHYKLRPMERAITAWLQKRIYVSRGIARRIPVTQWVGFAADEEHRAKKWQAESNRWSPRFPLIEIGMNKEDCVNYHRDRKLPEPIPSVCAGCFGHGLRSLKWMYENDKDAWNRTVERDRFIRHGLKQFGVKYPVYVSNTLVPLDTLAEQGFRLGSMQETAAHECYSGVCFT